MDKTLLFSIKESELKTLLQVKYCKAQDNTRPILQGMCFNDNNGQIETCCLDGYRASKRTLNNVQISDNFNFVLDNESILKLYKIPKKNDNIVNVYKNNNYLEFDFVNQGKMIECTLIKGEYVNYNQIIPEGEQELELKINSKELLKAVKALKVPNELNIIKLTIQNNTLILETHYITKEYSEKESLNYQQERQEAYNIEYKEKYDRWIKKNKRFKEPVKRIAKFQKVYIPTKEEDLKVNVPCEVIRNNLEDNFRIAFNIKYILEAIKLYKNKITLKFDSPVTPCVVTQDDKNLELVLPVRILQ